MPAILVYRRADKLVHQVLCLPTVLLDVTPSRCVMGTRDEVQMIFLYIDLATRKILSTPSPTQLELWIGQTHIFPWRGSRIRLGWSFARVAVETRKWTVHISDSLWGLSLPCEF
uniref:Uncharacterized protein n=1 Tax=Physcomitrium patens TaxID=3218 RepID=A0A2K1JZZ7_PHYPA|nr:uncharacterized protein LOC112287767 [Physcomitrium patens]PNR47102.1 hypothetical protein PHYPA_014222 [Physcomitrium patens]|eukprot:XP_024386909.1 uncharacterized protein LOC112287767 [Physcomitrella patens]